MGKHDGLGGGVSSACVLMRAVALAAPTAVAMLASPNTAHAHGAPMSEQFFKDCAAVVGSMPTDARVPLGRRFSKLPPRNDGAPGADSCAKLNWAKAKGKIAVVTAAWAGRTTTSAWDCNHSTLGWALYRKNGAAYVYVGGGFSFGNMAEGDGGTCRYDKTGFPQASNWGVFGLNTGKNTAEEYRIAWDAWSHDDPGLGHQNYCADPINCQWPIEVGVFGQAGAIVPPRQDFTIWRPGTGVWWWRDSITGASSTQAWGQAGDAPVWGEYDGDYNTDFAIRRRTNQKYFWFVINSSTGQSWQAEWGVFGDVNVSGGDYDGDGRADLAVFRPGNGTWYVIKSNTWTSATTQFGTSGDVPVVGNYDKDLKSDITVWRPSTGVWHTLKSNSNNAYVQTQWGINGDKPVSADFDGDGVTDVAVWRPSNGTFYWIDSVDGQTWQAQWGINGDLPAPSDMDGDWRSDFVVFRGTEGRWYYVNSSTGSSTFTDWGQVGDFPATPFTRGD